MLHVSNIILSLGHIKNEEIMKNQLTATYEMTNVKTGTKHFYNVIRKKKGFTNDQILKKFNDDLQNFCAFKDGLFILSSDIIVTDYRNKLVNVIKVLN
jgi:hypothetical protein